MPVSIQKNHGWLEVVFSGTITADELFKGARAMAEIERQEPVTPLRLHDLSEVGAFDLDFRSMQQFVDLRKKSRLKNFTRSAIVAPLDLQYGFARMYQTTQENPDIEVKVFRDKAEAVVWLAELPKRATD